MSNTQRHDLHSGLEEVLGPQRAEILMDYLPPVGWADVATKRDLDGLEERMAAEMGLVRSEMSVLRAEVTTEVNGLAARLEVGISSLSAKLDVDINSLDGRLDSGLTGLDQKLDVGLAGLSGKLDVETANRRTDIEKLEKSMEALKGAVLREQRIHLVVMITVLSGIAAITNLFG